MYHIFNSKYIILLYYFFFVSIDIVSDSVSAIVEYYIEIL